MTRSTKSTRFANGPVIGGNVSDRGYINGTERETIVNQTDVTYRLDMGQGIRHTLWRERSSRTRRHRHFRETTRCFARLRSWSMGNGTTSRISARHQPDDIYTSFLCINFQRDWNTEVSTYSGYIQDQLEITKYFELIGGLRFDRFDVAFDVNDCWREQQSTAELSRVDDVWSHRVGAVFKPTETASIYIATSNSFLPGAGDQFGNLTTRKWQSRCKSPKNFRMTKSGSNGRWPRACSSPAPFSSLIDPISLSIGTTGGANIGEQVGLTRTKGGELSLTGYVTDEWQISAGWGHQIARIVDAGTSSNEGNEVPFVPNNIYSLWNRYQFTPLFGAGLGIIHQDSSFAEANNAVEIPSFTRVDAAFYFDFNENWQAQVNVENIFDEEYFASAHNNNNISPGAPRQAFVTVRAKVLIRAWNQSKKGRAHRPAFF